MKLEMKQTSFTLTKPFSYKINQQYNYQKTRKQHHTIYYKWKQLFFILHLYGKIGATIN